MPATEDQKKEVNRNPEMGSLSSFIENQKEALCAAVEVLKFRSNQPARIHNAWRDQQVDFVAWVNFHQVFVTLAVESKKPQWGILIFLTNEWDALMICMQRAVKAGFLPKHLSSTVCELLLEYADEADEDIVEKTARLFEKTHLAPGKKWVDE